MGRSDWQMFKEETRAKSGVVVAKHPLAAKAGLEVLKRGGNAVDAAVTTALAVGVVEPYMSGLGAGGYMVYYEARSGKVSVVNFSMRAPQAARPDFFNLAEGYKQDLFAWRKVKDDANIMGATSVAVPGNVAGLSLALERFGSGETSWAAAVAPAAKLAAEGFYSDWFVLLRVASHEELLRRFPDTAAVMLPDGLPPVPKGMAGAKPLRQTALAATLNRLANEGPDYFYKGELARTMSSYLQSKGGLLSEEDLSSYRATVEEPLAFNYRDYNLFTPNGPTGGPTLAEHLQILDALEEDGNLSNPESWHRRIEAARLAWADRFEYLADPEKVKVPLDRLTSREYARERAKLVRQDGPALPYPVPAGQPGEYARSRAYGPNAAESTTHLIVIDAEHNMVTITQTLLSLYGSGVLEPQSGVLFNNGLMWFDPEPGRANSLASGQRPLTNMTPTLVLKGGKPVMALGASGGRRIPNSIAQVFLGVANGAEGVQTALDAPRFEGGKPDQVEIEERVGREIIQNLERRGHKLTQTVEDPLSAVYASPLAARVNEDGSLSGGSERWHTGRAEGF